MSLTQNIPWVEKYRPKKIDKILDQNEIIMTLKDCIKTNQSLPHMLFYGPPGTGKTTTALALCNQLYGPKYLKDRDEWMNNNNPFATDLDNTRIFVRGIRKIEVDDLDDLFSTDKDLYLNNERIKKRKLFQT